MKIVITTSSFGEHDAAPLERLRRAGHEVVLNPHRRKLTEDEAIALLADADAVLAGVEPLTRRVLAAAPRLRVVSRCGTGVDNVDLAAARERGIVVARTPDAPALGVAELTLALMLDALRGVARADRSVRAGGWERPMGRLLTGRAVGIVGLGHVGRHLARLLAPFDARILAHDPQQDDAFARAHRVSYVDLDTLLAQSDVVSLHLPLVPATRGLFDAKAFERMRAGSILVNTSRAEVLDEAALADALAKGRPAHAALDVFSVEPYAGPLARLPNVTLTSHLGSYAQEVRVRMEAEAADNLLDALEEKR